MARNAFIGSLEASEDGYAHMARGYERRASIAYSVGNYTEFDDYDYEAEKYRDLSIEAAKRAGTFETEIRPKEEKDDMEI